jgi:hypothetical protein
MGGRPSMTAQAGRGEAAEANGPKRTARSERPEANGPKRTARSERPEANGRGLNGRGDTIRTCDFQFPKLALYQAELRPDGFRIIAARDLLRKR